MIACSWRLGGLGALLALTIGVGCADGGAGKEPADSAKVLPKLENIDGIKARLAQPQPVIPRFDVPRDHWQAILAGLSTARFDFDPAKWEMMGTLESLLARIPTETAVVDDPTPDPAPLLRAADGDPSLAAVAPAGSEP